MKKMQDNKGFTLIELLIVVAIIGIIAAIAIPGLLRARQSGNEASAIGSVRAMASGEATFAASCGGGGYAQSLDDLSLLPPGSTVPFISPDLALNGVVKSGYTATLEPNADVTVVTASADTCNAAADALGTFYAHVEPVVVGSTGQRSFATDQRGTLYQKADGAPVAMDMSDGTILQ